MPPRRGSRRDRRLPCRIAATTRQRVRAPANTPIKLNLTTTDTYSCARAFIIPCAGSFGELLPATGTETLEIPPQKAGTRLQFVCSMGMYSGVIIFQ